jgi:PD-(D/E)XK nuclease superfamily protein
MRSWPRPPRSIISFTHLDQYFRCPLKYRLAYIDRIDPEFVPATLIFGRGIHEAAAHYFRGTAAGTPPSLADVQEVFASYWDLETSLKPVRFWKGAVHGAAREPGDRRAAGAGAHGGARPH